ncbi:MAG: B12-binding domain-containing protein [Ktedonobacterales bacterium]
MTYESYPTGAPARAGGAPPRLSAFSGAPKYDLPTIVQLVSVRSMVLVAWEQQFGIPAPSRGDEHAPRRYSERDLIAVLWMRDQILNGASPGEAAARLMAAQEPGSGPLFPARAPNATRPLHANATRPLTPSELNPSGMYARSSLSGGLGSTQARPSVRPDGTGPAPTRPFGPNSGALAPGSGALSASRRASGLAWESQDPSRSQHSHVLPTPDASTGRSSDSLNVRGREPRAIVPDLVRAFLTLDTAAAHRATQEALSGRNTVESVMVNLLQPALQRIGEMWNRREASTPEQRFAENYVRAMLFTFFHGTYEQPNGAMIIVGCGPRERNEIDALALAVSWRRLGARVIYLGQDMDADSLVEEVRRRRPALVAIAVSTSQRVRTLARLTRALDQLDQSQPTVGFYGSIFVRHPDLRKRVGGIYLGDDTATATFHLERLLAAGRPATLH